MEEVESKIEVIVFGFFVLIFFLYMGVIFDL